MKSKFSINEYVYTLTKNEGSIEIEQKQIQSINNTCLGIIYDCLDINNELEVCFESNLYTLEELIGMEF